MFPQAPAAPPVKKIAAAPLSGRRGRPCERGEVAKERPALVRKAPEHNSMVAEAMGSGVAVWTVAHGVLPTPLGSLQGSPPFRSPGSATTLLGFAPAAPRAAVVGDAAANCSPSTASVGGVQGGRGCGVPRCKCF